MKTLFLTSLVTLLTATLASGQQITAPGVKWDDTYTFDKCNILKIDFYAKGDELMRTLDYKVFYRSDNTETTSTGGLIVPKGNYAVLMDAKSKGSDTETIFDMANGVAIPSAAFNRDSGVAR